MGQDMSPDRIVDEALSTRSETISYTYTEPTVYIEYALDIMKLAKKNGLKNNWVSNGFMSSEALELVAPFLDATNIDLKSFSDDFYRKICGATLEPVLNALKIMKKEGVWIEIVNLVIPTLNDDPGMIRKMCEWIKTISPNIPLHFSRFFPDYLMKDYPPTGENILLKAGKIAKKAGLNHVYIGNIKLPKWGNTYCPKCKELVIERQWFEVTKNKLKNGKCSCNEKIAGVWK